VSLTPPDDGLEMSDAVCDEHKQLIDDGAPWRWEPDLTAGPTAGQIVMGDDLDAGALMITKYVGAQDHALVMAFDGTPATTLLFEQLRADGSRREVGLVVNEAVIDRLRHDFVDGWFGKSSPRPSED